MSLNSFNYMDGVPVKICEKYKPPPKVSIPQAVLNRLNITQDHYESNQFTYSFQLEKQVRKKLAEWKKMRDTERENRRERIRKYELQKCRDLEQRQKQLISSVTYPSAEDLSSDEEATADISVAKQETSPANDVVERNNHLPQQSFDTILQPIVANSFNSCSTLSPSTVFNYSKINYSDFENDTSSPFDNIELKTINDLDILAQVLNDTQRHSVENNSDGAPSENNKEEQLEIISDSKLEADQPNPVVNSSAAVNVEQECSVNLTTTTSSNQNQTSNYYYSTNVLANNYQMMVQQTQALCLQQQQQQHQQQQQQQQQQHQQHQQYMQNYANVIHHMKASSDVYLNYNCLPALSNHCYMNTDYSQQPETSNAKYDYLNGTFANNYCDPQYGMPSVDVVNSENRLEAEPIPKSKSKSVPDILRELKDEIRDSEIRRTRNHSQTIDDAAKRNSADSAQSQMTSSVTSTSGTTPMPTSFMKLSPSSQTLAKNISSMGFPLERVAKIAAVYGNDDKKIVEHLIPLSELLDLGFDESKISEALVKFDNNKDKALDFLIS